MKTVLALLLFLTAIANAEEQEWNIKLDQFYDVTIDSAIYSIAIRDTGIDSFLFTRRFHLPEQKKKEHGTDDRKDNRTLLITTQREQLFYVNTPYSKNGECRLVIVRR